MSPRCLAAALAIAILPTLAQAPKAHPNLQGYWTNATFTPLERPAELANKEFFTKEEAAEFDRKRLERENAQSKEDIHYDNALWQTETWGRVESRRTSIVFDPPNGKLPELSPEGKIQAAAKAQAARRRASADSAQDRSLAERCITWGNEGPPMLGSTYNANLQILQTSTQLVIAHEIGHANRLIPLDGRPHLSPAIHQLGGDSRGHWEGDTLVVDSTNFTDQTNFRGPPSTARQDIFSDANLHVVERFTLTSPNTITYRFTVTDPTVWTKPWSGELTMSRTKGPIYEYACHEGNYGLANILAGARAAEKSTAKTTTQGSR